MDSTADVSPLPVLDTAPLDGNAMPPELDDQEYRGHVLRLRAEQSEDGLDEDLIQRATALGIAVDRPDTIDHLHPSGAQSAVTTDCIRTTSTSDDSASTAPTNHSTSALPTPATAPSMGLPPLARRRSKGLSFSQYDKYLAEVGPDLTEPSIRSPRLSTDTTRSGSILSLSTRKSYRSIKEGIKFRVGWKKRSFHAIEPIITCVCCREDFHIDKTHQLRILPCGHTYCANCLNAIITQAMTDESKMPPRCCTQPIPSSTVKAVLPKEEHQAFLKAVLQFSTPLEARIFCPNAACAEFISPPSEIDPRHPFVATCCNCHGRVCVICKRDAHALGQNCPDDWELDAALKMGEESGWRRCYKCRKLVELTASCTHMTCLCTAQFCCVCGAVWDPVVGCPNFCNEEDGLSRRRMEDEVRTAEEEAEKTARAVAAAAELAERAEAENRTRECEQLNELFKEQEQEMQRFQEYQKTVRRKVWLRHGEQKKSLKEKYDDLTEKMKERHAKTAAHMEDRQVAAEMELRASLDHHEKSVRIRLKHMEAYCDTQASSSDENLPPRKVTERDLRELGQQYNVRDGMERLHQAKINVMRDQQAKRMEELLDRQAKELEKLTERHEEEAEDLAAEFAHKVDVIANCFEARKERLSRRWELALEIRRVEIQEEAGLKYAPMHPPEWPCAAEKPEDPPRPLISEKLMNTINERESI